MSMRLVQHENSSKNKEIGNKQKEISTTIRNNVNARNSGSHKLYSWPFFREKLLELRNWLKNLYKRLFE